jgi:hypothetical protein
MRLTTFLCAAACAAATPAAADVTITQTTSGKMMVMNLGGESVTRIKGNRLRIDQTGKDGTTLSTIIDIDGQRMISFDSKKKEATVMPLNVLQENLGKMTAAPKVKLTPTAETKQVAGYTCKVHELGVAFPFSPGGEDMQMTMVMSGPACLSTDAPGYADYQRVYRAAAEKGFIFGDPRAAKGPGASQARGLATLYKTFAEAGMPLEQQINIGLEGDNPMAGMMNRMVKSTISSTTLKVDTGDVAADLFDVPAGYKVKQQN